MASVERSPTGTEAGQGRGTAARSPTGSCAAAGEHADCPCSCLPSLATPSLADATADVVDSASVRVLAASALAARRKDEAEACSPDAGAEAQDRRDLRTVSGLSLLPAGEEEEEEEEEAQTSQIPSSGCRRPCDHQRQVPALRFPVVTQRQVRTVHSFMLPVQFLDKVLDMPVEVLRQVLGSMVQKTVVVPQLHFIDGRRHSLSFRRGRSPWSRLFSRPQRFPHRHRAGGHVHRNMALHN